MEIVSSKVITALKKFLVDQISENQIDYLIPLETKGALLVDYVYSTIRDKNGWPEILYLRSLEYMPIEKKQNSKFALFDDFVFSGRTFFNAHTLMKELNIPSKNIYKFAFYKFINQDRNEDLLHEFISEISVPKDVDENPLSQTEILKSVQKLALDKKIPASYDNLHWDVKIDEWKYNELMVELSSSSWFIYYGRRGRFDASVLLIPSKNRRGYDSHSKIRFWYDSFSSNLVISPIVYPSKKKSALNTCSEALYQIILPETYTEKQSKFSGYQANAICEQINLLSYLIPYYEKYKLKADLNVKQLHRYFGYRSDKVINFINGHCEKLGQLIIPEDGLNSEQRIDYYWISLEILRILGREYWMQKAPRKKSKGFSVAELLNKFANVASEEAIHAAIDYCADMNFIATFYEWKGNFPKRSFRLTENGEVESGRNDGKTKLNLSYFEKLGALIISKTKNKKAFWWMLEKIPALLIVRFKYPLPRIEATKSFYGDTSLLKIDEKEDYFIIWPKIKTDVWIVKREVGKKAGTNPLMFYLDNNTFKDYRSSIYEDLEIMNVSGAIETLMEITDSKTKGHHLAILIDILSDRSGGSTYLAYSIRKILSLINRQSQLSDSDDILKVGNQIKHWFQGVNEKSKILLERQQTLLIHLENKINKLVKQNRDLFATNLKSIQPFPIGNKIIPSLRQLAGITKRFHSSIYNNDSQDLIRIYNEIVFPKHILNKQADYELRKNEIYTAIENWTFALSGEVRRSQDYIDARLNVPDEKSYRMFIVAYDLIGYSSIAYLGRTGAERVRRIQSIINNWFIAFGGYSQRTEFGGGDLGFGFFQNLSNAVLACSWASYQLKLLKATDSSIQQETAHAGFGIVPDEINAGFMQQVKSDWLNKFAKAWKREAEHIAEKTGRNGLPLIAIQADLFSDYSNLPEDWLAEEGHLDNLAVRYIREDIIREFPWKKT
ncbi:MAG: hypothetical protein DAHOPDDO_00804 [Ignavibacteriaceae bacterium]|nr:hypothetical protein [Ignavibacteriaceae bacterium]